MFNFAPSFDSLFALRYPLGMVFIYLGVILIFAETLNRTTHLSAELTRKVVHIGSGNVILLAWWFDLPAWVILDAAFVATIIALISYFVPILPSINSVGRKSLGTFFYAVSIGILVAWFWYLQQPQYAAIGILVMAWGDGLAAIIGQNFGKHRYQILGITKSWEGSLTMLIVSYLVTSIILLLIVGNSWQIWLIALIVGVLATITECFSVFGVDNLTVPLGSAAIAYYCYQLL